MKKKIWLAVVWLAAICCSVILPACKPKTKNPVTTEPNGEETKGHYVDAVPPIDYNGQNFVIVTSPRTWAHTEMVLNESDGDVIGNAIFERTLNVNARLNINLRAKSTPGSALSAARNDIFNNLYAYDLYVIYPHDALTLFQEGRFADQETIDSIDFGNPWWETNFNDEVNVSTAKYVTYNQSNLVLYSGFYLWAFNKSIVAGSNLDNPYEMIENNEWTWANAYEMMKKVTTDVNSDGSAAIKDGDTFGLVGQVNHLQNLILSSGETIGRRNSDGVLTYNGLSAGYVDAFEKFTNYFIASNESAIASTDDFKGYTSSSGLANYVNYFNEGKALFLSTATNEVVSIRQSGVEYGVVVVPKYSAEQDEFITPVYKGVDGFAIPKRKDTDMMNITGTVLETLGAYSYNNLIDLHIGNVLHYRAANDPTAKEMIDLAYSNPMIDVCLANNFGGCSDIIKGLNEKGNPNCTQVFRENRRLIVDGIKKALQVSAGD